MATLSDTIEGFVAHGPWFLSFMPHGHCYYWDTSMLLLQSLADGIIGAAYFCIPYALITFMRKRTDLAFPWIFAFFSLVFVACGITHLMEVYTIFVPAYWLSGGIKAVAALISVAAAIALVKLVPQALALPSPADLHLANIELRSANTALHESEERFRTLVEGVQDYAIFALDAAGRVVSWNFGAQRIKGYRAEEIVGRNFSCFFTPEQIEEGLPERELKIAAREGRWESEGQRLRKDGSRFWAGVVVNALRDPSGNLKGYSKVTRDITARKEAEEALREAQENATTAVLERISDGFVTFDRDWRCLRVNSAAARVFRKPPEELLGKVLWDVFPETDRLLFDKEYRRAMTENVVVIVEDFYPEPLNAWFEMRCYPSTNGLSVFFSDITKRKRMEETLRDSEQRFRALVEQAPDGFELLDENGRYLDMNRATCQQLGYTREELLRMSISEIDPVVNWKQFAANFPSMEKKPSIFETMHMRKGGSAFPVEVTASVIRMGDARRVLSLVRDITERKATEQRLRQLSRAVDQSPNSVVITDTKGDIEYVNPKFTAITGYSFDEVYGKNPRILKSGTLPPSAYKKLWETIRAGGEWHGEFYNKKKNGEFYWESATICPITDENSVITHFLAVKEDITERKHAEQALLEAKQIAEQANQAKDDFIAALSHELRTPLTPVLLTASFLQDDETLSPDLREHIDLIRHNVQIEARLIDDLLDLSKIAHGKISLQPEAVDVGELLSKALEIMREDIVSKSLTVQVQTDARHVGLYGDPARLQQVFWNLLKNAAKFTPSGGNIHIQTFNPDPRTLCVEFSDTGIGIAPEFLETIFRPFEQGAVSGDYNYSGLGLGLSISKAIVGLHGGTLSVVSEGPDLGATFTVCLPVSLSADVGQPPPGAPLAGKTAPLHILLVEDDENTRSVLARLLTRDGHRVEAVATCSAAIALAKATAAAGAEPFALLISDIGLPDGSGLDIARKMKALSPEIKAIALSGYGTEVDIRNSNQAGFSAHLTKPISFDELRRTLAT